MVCEKVVRGGIVVVLPLLVIAAVDVVVTHLNANVNSLLAISMKDFDNACVCEVVRCSGCQGSLVDCGEG